jgi:hypothetical protein
MIYITDNLSRIVLLIINLLIIFYFLSPLLLNTLFPNKELVPDILNGVVIIIGLLVAFSILEINLNNNSNMNVHPSKIITIENFDNKKMPPQELIKFIKRKKEEIIKNSTSSYVESLCNGSPAEIESKCSKLTVNNCKLTDCCVLLNKNKCVSGSSTGPTFLTDDKNNDITFDSYYHKNTCYGKCS